ncbi:hypothetical protein ABVT39_025097 [Epinephelus coioides]
MAISLHADVDPQLVKADKKISDLKEDIRWLSGELNIKSSMLTALQEVAHEQLLQITSLTAALQDTVHWDPSAWPPLSSSSTPSRRWSWVEVVGRGKRGPGCAASPPRLSLSNHYSTLASDGGPDAGTADAAAAAPSPPTSAVAAAPCLEESASASNVLWLPLRRPVVHLQRPAWMDPRLPRWHLWTGVPWLQDPTIDSHPGFRGASEAPKGGCMETLRGIPLPQPGWHYSRPPSHAAWTVHLPHMSHPIPIVFLFVLFSLLPPCCLETASSGILVFFNATTHCFPGATVPVIVDKLPELLHSLPSSINWLIFHLGSDDTARRQSEQTKMDFVALFNLLKNCGLTGFTRAGWAAAC